jgi:hypothetical protein
VIVVVAAPRPIVLGEALADVGLTSPRITATSQAAAGHHTGAPTRFSGFPRPSDPHTRRRADEPPGPSSRAVSSSGARSRTRSPIPAYPSPCTPAPTDPPDRGGGGPVVDADHRQSPQGPVEREVEYDRATRADERRTRQLLDGSAVGPVRFPVTRHRWEGFRDAWTQAGHPAVELRLAACPVNNGAEGEAFTAELLDGADPPDAIAAMSDELALGVLQAAARAGLAVPEIVAVTGWDDSDAAAAAGLTTLAQSLREQGARCARVALGRHAEVPAREEWQVVVRTTTRPAAMVLSRRRRVRSRGCRASADGRVHVHMEGGAKRPHCCIDQRDGVRALT